MQQSPHKWIAIRYPENCTPELGACVNMDIEWTDEDPVSGDKRFVRAERFARQWQFKVRFRRRTNWEAAAVVTRAMWETLLDALERRYPRREGVTDEDLKQVRAIIAGLAL